MKKRHTTTLELYAKTVRMRTAEKRALRERLVSYMEYHPSRVSLREAEVPRIESPLPTLSTEPFTVFRFNSWQFRAFSSIFVLFLMVGIPLVAERSVPGDVLYAMKLRVNEEVKASLAWTPAEKIAWEAERVERRIAEARLLAKEGNLSNETEAAIAATVREHAENASLAIAELRTTDVAGAEVAQVALESTLEVQTAILAHASTGADASTTIDSLAASVAEVKQGVSAHDSAEEPTLDYDAMSALLEKETTRARELATSIVHTVTDVEKQDIDRRIVDIERAVAETHTLYNTGRHNAARSDQRKILSDIQKMISFMTDIDVRNSISLESLVPKKLTSEEQLALISADLEQLKNEEVRVKKEGTLLPEDVGAKYEQSVADLRAMIVSIETFRTEGRFDEALSLSRDAHTLIADLVQLRTVTEIVDDATTTPDGSTATEETNEIPTDVATSTDVDANGQAEQ